jgi:RNA polymerase sigma-70 factor (ECF subfamily)
VVRLLVTLVPALVRIGVVVEPHELNGEPGAILRDATERS